MSKVFRLHKNRNTRLFTRIPGNLLEDSGECYHFRISGNVQEDSEEYCTIFQGISEKIPGNIREDSGECPKRYRCVFNEILGNVQEDSGDSRIFRRIFENIPTNGFKFELIKDT